jgi:hypothetical protein
LTTRIHSCALDVLLTLLPVVQDCILFRDSDLTGLVESDKVPWLGPAAGSYAAMVESHSGEADPTRLRNWAPYMMNLRADEAATIVSSVSLQYR